LLKKILFYNLSIENIYKILINQNNLRIVK